MTTRGEQTDVAARSVVTVDTGGTGTTYLLVHGIGVSSRYFERLIPVLAETGRVVAIDLPGFGGRPKPDMPMGVEDFAASVAEVMDTLALPPCVIVGHSMGTQVAVALATMRPESVGALVLIGPVMDPRARGAVHAALRLGWDTLGERPRANRLVLGDYLRCGLRWYLAVLPSMLAYRIEDDLSTIEVPTLIVRGESDPIAPDPWMRQLGAAALRSTVATVSGARHLVMHAKPRETAAAIAALIWSAR